MLLLGPAELRRQKRRLGNLVEDLVREAAAGVVVAVQPVKAWGLKKQAFRNPGTMDSGIIGFAKEIRPSTEIRQESSLRSQNLRLQRRSRPESFVKCGRKCPVFLKIRLATF
jgi:hypothetical protein